MLCGHTRLLLRRDLSAVLRVVAVVVAVVLVPEVTAALVGMVVVVAPAPAAVLSELKLL